ncbi:MAG: MarR family transcriptional regulator [Ignavibacteriales bacterium CG12_big_fil_rev_8_21_14_0_65_30_8]|nr:MAG: MarR family transcriptional regulator [Ignavibacteriales bacterium CG12_big_fil_rev_8_21_14_0_65_30_8]
MKIEEEIKQKHFKSEYHKAIVNIIFTYNWLIKNHVEILKPFDITLQQYNILRILRGQYPNPSTIKLMKERMLDRMSDCSRIVEKLVKKGLVERNLCKEDRRNVDVLITKNGLALLKKLDKKFETIDKDLIHLNTSEVKTLNTLLDKLRG